MLISAYYRLAARLDDRDVREAERFTTAEHIDGGGMMQLLRDAQPTADFRDLLRL